MKSFIKGAAVGLVISAILLAAQFAKADQTVLLGTANTVTLRGEITDETAQKAALEVLFLAQQRAEKEYPIYLVLDTPGGDINAGETLIEIVKAVPNVHTVTIFAASMGSSIVEALPGERLIVDSGILMFHRAKGTVGGQFETGELETRLEFYKKFVRRMESRSAKRMSMSLKEYKQKIKDEMWLGGQESVESKAADKVVTISCTQALIEKNEHMSMQVFIFKVELDFSGCPLLRTPTPSKDQPEEAVQAFQKYRGLI